jgi:hypothetical protein
MGNTQSSDPENNGAGAAFDPETNGAAEVLNNPTSLTSIIAIVLSIIAILVVFNDYIFHRIPPTITQAASVNPSGMLQKIQSTFKFGPSNFLGNLDWKIITPMLILLFCALFFMQYLHFTLNKPISDVNTLVSMRKNIIDGKIGSMSPNGTYRNNSLTAKLSANPRVAPYTLISSPSGDPTAMVNFRPLTVRLAGYLGGPQSITNGVFEMSTGISQALNLGARAFVFDIDYLDKYPCQPAVMFRDASGIKRSLNTGSIRNGMQQIATRAFENDNLDPVLVILYLRRVPKCPKQKAKFFEKIAISLDPLSPYHLGQTQDGNFHSCQSESALFTTPIVNFQKKIIVMTNYNTTSLDGTQNPKNSLNWWTNARIWQHPSGLSNTLGSVTSAAPTSPGAYAQVGDLRQFLGVGPDSADSGGPKPTSEFQSSTLAKFTIALTPPEVPITVNEMSKLINTLGVQCVPLDVLALGQLDTHVATMQWKSRAVNNVPNATPTTIAHLSDLRPDNSPDLLAFWTYTGWSRKSIVTGFQDYKSEGFEDVAAPIKAQPIPGYIIQNPKRPNKPSPTMNAAGGIVSIA